MPDLTEQTLPVDETSAVTALLTGEPEKAEETAPETAQDAAMPEKEEQAATPEKEAIDYGMKVPMPDGVARTLGELKDYYQEQQKHTAEIIDRENGLMQKAARAQDILSFVDSLPPQVRAHAEALQRQDDARQAEMLRIVLPETESADGMDRVRKAVFELTDSYGIPRAAINNVSDHMTIKVLYDFARLKASIKEAKDKVKPFRSENPKGVAPSADPTNELQAKIAKAKQSRNSADEASAVDALLRSA